jgi:hypothetical protein
MGLTQPFGETPLPGTGLPCVCHSRGVGHYSLLAALKNTVITIVAPVILTELSLGDNFIFVHAEGFQNCHFSLTR